MAGPEEDVTPTPYFAYGSNLDQDQMRRREVTFTSAVPAVLQDFRLDFTAHSDRWGGGVADVVEEEGSAVEGALYMVTEGMAQLDLYEGVKEGMYRRRWITVDVAGKGHRAVLYEVCSKVPGLRPSRKYMAAIISGSLQCGLSEAYVEALKSISTID